MPKSKRSPLRGPDGELTEAVLAEARLRIAVRKAKFGTWKKVAADAKLFTGQYWSQVERGECPPSMPLLKALGMVKKAYPSKTIRSRIPRSVAQAICDNMEGVFSPFDEEAKWLAKLKKRMG